VLALVAMLMRLLKETLNPDSFAMAMMDAADDAKDAGVSPQEWERVQKIVMTRWAGQRRRNPLSSLF
jgi:hypothetical protein